MGLYPEGDRAAAEAIAELCYTNPFSARRIELERRALGPAFVDGPAVWSRTSLRFSNPNVPGLCERTRGLLHAGHVALERGYAPSEAERRVHAALVRYHLFEHFDDPTMHMIEAAVASAGVTAEGDAERSEPVAFYREFRREAERYYGVRGLFPEQRSSVPHLFATNVQARLAFTLIFQSLLGTSRAAAALRAATWESIFTHDMHRYERVLFARMHDIATLVLGASGTGKELVARAIALSGHVPFDGERERFVAPLASDFRALNLSAMSPALIESELFGHRRGSFTGAAADRKGFFELCSEHGAVFLDEVGELDGAIQVKLLRVLQSRRFERVGDHEPRRFRGRIIAATHRDLPARIAAGAFRQDFYYRLCADTITTPSLAEQLAQAPGDLHAFVEHTLERVLGGSQGKAGEELAALCEQTVEHIEKQLGSDYAWPGNVRELEQCVRSFVVHRSYAPAPTAPRSAPQAPAPAPTLDTVLATLEISGNELLERYCAALYTRLGNVQAVARTVGSHRDTVKARLAAARRAAGR